MKIQFHGGRAALLDHLWQSLDDRGGELGQRTNNPRQQKQKHSDNGQSLRDKRQSLLMDRGHRLKQADGQPNDHRCDQERRGNGKRLINHSFKQFNSEFGIHNMRGYIPKLRTNEWITRSQPSTSTNRSIFNGREIVVGGIIIMPMLINTVATIRSIKMNGT
jgi:hypothetical protein